MIDEALAETTNLGGLLGNIVPAIQQELEQGEANERVLREKVIEQQRENGRLRTILRAIDPSLAPVRTEATAAPAPARERQASQKARRTTGQTHIGVKRRNGTATGYGITMERAIDFATAAKTMQDRVGYVTQKDLYTALQRDQGECSSAFQWFLAIGFVRRAGQINRRDKFVINDASAPWEALRITEGKA